MPVPIPDIIPDSSGIALWLKRKLVWGNIFGDINEQADLLALIASNIPPSTYVYTVETLADLPAPVGNVITIATGYTVEFKNPNLSFPTGIRLHFKHNTSVNGTSSETAFISGNLGNGEAFITAEGSLPMRNITISVSHNGIGAPPKILDLDGSTSPNAALDWLAVNFVSPNYAIGTIANYGNVALKLCAIINSVGGLAFSGTFDSIVFETCIARDSTAGGTLLTFDPAIVINRRIRIENMPMEVPVGSVGIDLPLTATVNTEGYIAKFLNFTGGGTYIQGIQPADNRAFFFECRGVENSNSLAQYYINSNLTPTPIAAVGTYTKVLGTSISSPQTQRFSMPVSNQAYYTGAIKNTFAVTATVTFTSGNNDQIAFRLYTNGVASTTPPMVATADLAGRAENVVVIDVTTLSTGDYIELWVANLSATNAVVVNNLVLRAIKVS